MEKVNCHPVFRIREADRMVLVLVCLLGSLLHPEPTLAERCTARGFVVAPTFAVGMFPASVTVSDFNRDGKPDLAVANNGSDNISVLLGNGAGAFQAAVNYSAGFAPGATSAGDLNGDGNPDLVVADYSFENKISVLLGRSGWGFQRGRQTGPGGGQLWLNQPFGAAGQG
jgi:hypothetical protein